jgi:hypothetical protein
MPNRRSRNCIVRGAQVGKAAAGPKAEEALTLVTLRYECKELRALPVVLWGLSGRAWLLDAEAEATRGAECTVVAHTSELEVAVHPCVPPSLSLSACCDSPVACCCCCCCWLVFVGRLSSASPAVLSSAVLCSAEAWPPASIPIAHHTQPTPCRNAYSIQREGRCGKSTSTKEHVRRSVAHRAAVAATTPSAPPAH